MRRLLIILVLCAVALPASAETRFQIERVTTAVPFPRGLEIVDGQLYVLARGRVRSSGGVSAEVEDRAGTIFRVNQTVGELASDDPVSDAVMNNGDVVAEPTDPPMRLWDRTSNPPEADTRTDRPYCVMRWHEPTQSFYICAFAGIDLKSEPGKPSFSKNFTDGILRYDLRTQKWHEVDRHEAAALDRYPHHDPSTNAPPHGWLKGPDNLIIHGNWAYAVGKDNSRLVAYDLTPLIDDPDAVPGGQVVLDDTVQVKGLGERTYLGHSMLAVHEGWLYVGYRTSSVIIRLKLDEETGLPVEPKVAELVGEFTPWDPVTKATSDLTDMCFDAEGNLYVVSAAPAAVHRFRPDPATVYNGRRDTGEPWLDLATLLDNPYMKSENVLVDDKGPLYVTSGDGYSYQAGADGTVYRVTWDDR